MEQGTQRNPARQSLRGRVFGIIEVGPNEDFIGRGYDVLNLVAIVINLTVSVMMTYDAMMESHGSLLQGIEAVTVAFFAIDYLLRLWTSSFLYPGERKGIALLRYVFSFNGLVDMLSCVPYYLPIVFPTGVAAFRVFRVMRIFRIFRVNAYSDSLNLIMEVLKGKAKLLFSSVFIILMLMLAASLTMYSLEHGAQPEVFDNALSGLWWAAATLLTVGYGDIYPVTPLGRIVGILITMLGVGLVAIPTGIISAGFVEQYEKLKKASEQAVETELHFIRVALEERDAWVGHRIRELQLPRGILIAALQRGREIIAPRGDVELQAGDRLVLGAQIYQEDLQIELKEIELKERHEWNGLEIKDLDISRQTFIVTVRRGGRTIIPRGDLRLQAGDVILLYTKQRLRDTRDLTV